MKWLEAIKVQAASGQENVTQHELKTLTQDVCNSSEVPGLLETMLHQHALIPGCFVIHLFWETESPNVQGSTLGLQLKYTLKTFGLVDHTVWIEEMGGKEAE